MIRPVTASALAALLLAACASEGAGPEPPVSAPAPRSASPTPPPGSTPAAPAPPTPADPGLDFALIEAAWDNDLARARGLIERGADVNAQDRTGQSAFLIAASEGHTELLELALDHGADVASLDSFDGTALIRAAERGHADIVGRLVRAGVAVNHVNNLGWTALHEAVEFADRAGGPARGDAGDYVDTVRVLVAAGADASIPARRSGRTAGETARAMGLRPQADLLERVDGSQDPGADRRLLDAAASGDTDGAALALAGGADLEARGPGGRTPLVTATKNRRAGTARVLMYLGADVNAKDAIEDSAFLYAGAEGYNDILRETLRHGADVRSTNRFDGTALIPASEHGYVETVRILLATDVPVNHVNNLGWTALHEAIVLGTGSPDHVEVVRLLLEHGADPTIPDGDGVLPRDLAAARGFDEIVDAIEAAS